MFLEAHFGEVELHMPDPSEEEPEQGEDNNNEASLLVRLDEADARINLVSMVCVRLSWTVTFSDEVRHSLFLVLMMSSENG